MRIAIPLLILTLAACGSPITPKSVESSSDEQSDTSGDGTTNNRDSTPDEPCTNCDDEPEPDDTSPEPTAGSPVILDFGTNTASANENTTLTFTAIVTDPDGIDDLIGGSLKSPEGASYGAFQTASQEGAYEIELRFPNISDVDPLLFETTTSRRFVADFYDQAGNRVQAETVVSFSCADRDSTAACEPGQCVDTVENMEHCGSCGNDCSVYEDLFDIDFDTNYADGRCLESACRIDFRSIDPRPCDEQCGPLRCIESSGIYNSYSYAWSCDEPFGQNHTDDFGNVEDFVHSVCYCSD